MQENSKYNFKKIEQKWQKKWAKQNLYQTNETSDKPKKYILVEFPYPSGFGLHIGHAFTNTGADIYARYQRMKGYNVLFPYGYDAFGLPTENYAIKNKLKPQDATRKNIDKFREQIKMLAFSFDMEREFSTTDPDYYKWTQWIFIQLYKKGLAYKKEMPINWCPSCKTGLANEEVIDGKCERCGAETSKKNLNQWVLKITEYADRLADELDLTDFPKNVIASQRNWIDRKEWIDITYPIYKSKEKVVVSTTRPDTNFGATFVVVAPEHPILDPKKGLIPKQYAKEVNKYVAKALKKSELSRIADGRNKTGVFTGLYAVNQLNDQKMPVYVTDFVLMSVGTGAVVGVPGHDIRDFEFAQKFELPVIRVVVGSDGDTSEITRKEQVQEKEGTMINSEFLDEMDIHTATQKIMDYLEEKGWGKRTVRYHLRDWIFSRQHYWGEPIPMVYCEKCGWNPVDEKDLPILLPDVENYEPTDTGESPLADIHDWVKTTCPKCGGPGERETDTMPNWAGSSWYYLRYIDPKNTKGLGDKQLLKKWMPVDVYIGGSEHTTLHLLYSRFWHKVLNDLDLAPGKEPYLKRVEHGVILGPDGKRMSKSTGNVLIPDDITQKYGVDATRTYLMFIGPFEGTMAWNERALKGICRFLDRFYHYISESIISSPMQDSDEVKANLAGTVNKISDCLENFRFNTGVSSLMEMLNFLESHKSISQDSIETILKLLAPYAPYIADELWEQIGHDGSIHKELWPESEEELLVDQTVIVPVQVNGKVRGSIEIASDDNEDSIKKKVMSHENVSKYVEGKKVKKFVYVKDRIVSILV